jgi:hypothetical protein
MNNEEAKKLRKKEKDNKTNAKKLMIKVFFLF